VHPPVSPTGYRLETTNEDAATLVQMIKSKNEKGFHILYDNYSGALYGILMKLVRRTDVAEDLLQDAFVKIWKHIDAFDPARGTLFTWMLNIARNHAIDYLRSSGYKNQLHNVNMDLLSHQVDYISATASNTLEIEVKDFKNKALQIESKYSEIIDMIFFYGFTQQQTATMLNLPLGTVKTRARKGLSMLKVLYKQ
jgi:RNA polymerase sigma-70 factor (ECF subfamily)